MVADVGSARSDAIDAEVVVAATSVAVNCWIVMRPFFPRSVIGMTSEDLSHTNRTECNEPFIRPTERCYICTQRERLYHSKASATLATIVTATMVANGD